MADQPIALHLADALEGRAERAWTRAEVAAELRRLSSVERAYDALALAYNEWTEKTQWVQETKQTHELGMHRADVLKQRIERLNAENSELLEALRVAALALAHATETVPVVYDDHYNRVSAAIAKAKAQQ